MLHGLTAHASFISQLPQGIEYAAIHNNEWKDIVDQHRKTWQANETSRQTAEQEQQNNENRQKFEQGLLYSSAGKAAGFGFFLGDAVSGGVLGVLSSTGISLSIGECAAIISVSAIVSAALAAGAGYLQTNSTIKQYQEQVR